MLKRPSKDKENLPLRDKGHPKWKNWYHVEYRISRSKLGYMKRLVQGFIGKSFDDCYKAIIKHMHEDKLSEFANLAFVEKQIISTNCSVAFVKNRITNEKIKIVVDNNLGKRELADNALYVDENKIVRQYSAPTRLTKQLYKAAIEEKIKEFNGFVKDGYWFKKIRGVWHIADTATQQLVEKKAMVENKLTGVIEEVKYFEPKYRHAYRKVANSYSQYTFGNSSKFQYYVTPKERKFLNSMSELEDKAKVHGAYNSIRYSQDRLCATLFPGAKVAIHDKVCNKQILRKYGLTNDTPEVQLTLRQQYEQAVRRGHWYE